LFLVLQRVGPFPISRLSMKTKGEIEAEITKAITQFKIDYMGRGPTEAKSRLVEDMILVWLKGVLTPAERQLAETSDGSELVKKLRATLIEKAKPLLFQVVGDITGVKVLDLHTDISVSSGTSVFIFTLERDLEREGVRKRGA